MPQSGPRGSPLTDVRHACPASTIATATVAPAGTTTGVPLTVTETWSTEIWLSMRVLVRHSRWQVRFNRDFRLRAVDLIGKNAGGSQRSRDSQALMPGRQEYGRISCPRPNQRKFVGSSSTKPRPGANG